MAWSDFEAPNRSCDLISAPCSTIPTNWRRIGGIASLTQPSGNVPSNFDWWSGLCRLKTFAAFAITSASEYSEAFDNDNATSFWNPRRTPLPFLWAWSSGISTNNLSFNLVVLTLGILTPVVLDVIGITEKYLQEERLWAHLTADWFQSYNSPIPKEKADMHLAHPWSDVRLSQDFWDVISACCIRQWDKDGDILIPGLWHLYHPVLLTTRHHSVFEHNRAASCPRSWSKLDEGQIQVMSFHTWYRFDHHGLFSVLHALRPFYHCKNDVSSHDQVSCC